MFITQNINAAKSAEIGNVITHVIIIRCAVFHLTPLALLEAPTPRIDDDTTCVVDNGKCNDEATNIVNAMISQQQHHLWANFHNVSAHCFNNFPSTNCST